MLGYSWQSSITEHWCFLIDSLRYCCQGVDEWDSIGIGSIINRHWNTPSDDCARTGCTGTLIAFEGSFDSNVRIISVNSTNECSRISLTVLSSSGMEVPSSSPTEIGKSPCRWYVNFVIDLKMFNLEIGVDCTTDTTMQSSGVNVNIYGLTSKWGSNDKLRSCDQCQKKLTNVTQLLTTFAENATEVVRKCVTFVSFFWQCENKDTRVEHLVGSWLLGEGPAWSPASFLRFVTS